MKTKNYYAVQVTVTPSKKLLCWKGETNALFFAENKRGFEKAAAPTLFTSKSDAKSAIEKANNSRTSRSKLKKMFHNVIEATDCKVVKLKVQVA